ARFLADFDQVQANRVVERRVPFAGSAEDVGRQLSIACAGLDQIEMCSRQGRAAKDLVHLRELHLNQLAKQRTDIDARKKIARATGSPDRAGVVTRLWIVERQIHERGHSDRAALTDRVANLS